MARRVCGRAADVKHNADLPLGMEMSRLACGETKLPKVSELISWPGWAAKTYTVTTSML